jgi:hypothetical protein
MAMKTTQLSARLLVLLPLVLTACAPPPAVQPVAPAETPAAVQPVASAQTPAAAQPVASAQTPAAVQPVASAQTPATVQPATSAQTPATVQPVTSAQTPTAAQPVASAQTPAAAQPVAPAVIPAAVQPAASAVIPASVDLSRPAVIGASATAGFGLDGVNLTKALCLELGLETEAAFDGGRLGFFLSPEGIGESLVQDAAAFQPSAVIALDYLFWFAYGNLGGADERQAMLERGLAFLDGLGVPTLVSTLPDMKASIGKMLSASMVPDGETLARLNAVIRSWAADRQDVYLFDLPALMDHLKSRRPIQLAARAWPVDDAVSYIQEDQLHPTRIGLSFVTCALLDELMPGREVDPPALGLALDELALELEAASAAGGN